MGIVSRANCLGASGAFFTQSQCQSCTLCAGFDKSKPLHEQIDDWADMVHFHFPYEGELHKPFVCTEHSNSEVEKEFPINTIYLSSKHAENNHATCYVHNGLYWPDYGEPNFKPKDYCHF